MLELKVNIDYVAWIGRRRMPDRSPYNFRQSVISPSPASVGNHRPRQRPTISLRVHRFKMDYNRSSNQVPRFILFGDSLTEWSFDSSTQGFGWYLTELYKGKAEMVNEGTTSIHCSTLLRNQTVTSR
jgi:hypothetical protein